MKLVNYTQKILLAGIVLVFAFSSNGLAQNQDEIERAKMKYNKSIKYNDFAMAKNAIYDLMVLEPNNNSYLDSLAYMYFEFEQYASAALVSKDGLKESSNNQLLLQIGAKSLDKLGAKDQSLKMYQKLYDISDDGYVLYEVIQQQYALKKYGDAMINTELLLGKSIVDESNVYAEDTSGNEIEISFKAMILNLQGMIARGQGDEESAKKYFNSALKLAPNYALPQENLNPTD